MMKNKVFALFAAAILAVTGVTGFVGCAPTTNTSAADTKPAAVKNLKAKAGNGEVTLTWTNPTAKSFKGVDVYVEEKLEATLDKSKSSYKVTGLTNGKEYTFSVFAYFDGYDELDNSLIVSVSATPAEKPAVSSVEFAENLVIGWNLGNAFDASDCGDWAYNEGVKLEYSWLPHKQATSQKLIKTVKNTGFKTIRIPVSWHNHMAKNTTTYQIDSAWMNRVKTVVDWALAEDMYVIINIHHDNLSEEQIASNPGFCLSTDSAIQTKSKDFISKVWGQIAETFKDYDEHLIFEIINEPRCIGTDFEWGFWGTNAGKESTYSSIITKYEQAGLDVIRASGGNNADRFVMAPGYAASPSYLSSYSLPKDTASDKLLLSTHAYTPSDFALSGDKTDYAVNKSYIESSINGVFNDLKSKYVDKKIGVVMGEASASDKENTASREKWATYYFTKAKAVGIPVVLWDNEVVVAELDAAGKAKYNEGENGENHGYFNRVTCQQYFPAVVEAMITAAGGSANESGNNGGAEEEEQNPTADTLVVYTAAEAIGTLITTVATKYETFITLDKEYDGTDYSKIVVELKGETAESTVQIQLQAQDSNGVPSCDFAVSTPVTDFKICEGVFGAPNTYIDYADDNKEKTMSSKIAKLRVVTQNGSWGVPGGDKVYVKSITLKK